MFAERARDEALRQISIGSLNPSDRKLAQLMLANLSEEQDRTPESNPGRGNDGQEGAPPYYDEIIGDPLADPDHALRPPPIFFEKMSIQLDEIANRSKYPLERGIARGLNFGISGFTFVETVPHVPDELVTGGRYLTRAGYQDNLGDATIDVLRGGGSLLQGAGHIAYVVEGISAFRQGAQPGRDYAGAESQPYGGAGATWKTVGEVRDLSIEPQIGLNGCGPATISEILKDVGIRIRQLEVRWVAAEQFDRGYGMFAVDIQDTLNGIEEGANLIRWQSAQAFDGVITAEQQFGANGSWIAHLDTGGEIGHFVIVDGMDEFGYVLIRDVAQGTRYRVGVTDFDKSWSGHWIARQ